MAGRSVGLCAALVAAAFSASAEPVAGPFFEAAPLHQTSGEVTTSPPAGDQRGPVRVGLMVGVVSVPRPISAELFARLYDLVGIGASYSTLPKGLGDLILSAASVKDVTIESSAFDGELRLFPFRGSFFVGSALGRQTLAASASRQGTTVNVDMVTLYATPRLGWLGIWDNGFSLSLDAGVQLPLSTDATATSGNPDAASAAQSAAKALGNQPLPSVNLRVGLFL